MSQSSLQNRVAFLLGKQREVYSQITTFSISLAEQKKLQQDLEATGNYLKNLAAEMQKQVQMSIETLVQQLLDACFPGKGYTFQMNLKEARGNMVVEMVLEKEGKLIDPIESCGGGLTDVISVALRFGILLVSNVPKVLFLDEPFKNLSRNLKPQISQLIYDLANQYGICIIMVSHEADFIKASNRVYKVSQVAGISQVEVVENG